MSLGRRKVRLEEASRWVFNRMADVYDARPPYPSLLIDAIADFAYAGIGAGAGMQGRQSEPGSARVRIGDLGAGIGHLALPLAERGFDVVAVEPAQAMLDRLRDTAAALNIAVRPCHATAEALPLPDGSLDVVVVADALHFMDAQLAAEEIARVLTPRGALVVITCGLGSTPYMRDVVRVIEEAVPRRPRDLVQQMVHVSSITNVPMTQETQFHDETAVDADTLERILRSISFIGPAMNPRRFANFRVRVHALSETPRWARTFVLRAGRRGERPV